MPALRFQECDGAIEPGNSVLKRSSPRLAFFASMFVRGAWLLAGVALVLAAILMLAFFRLFYDTRFYRYRLFRTRADPKTTEDEEARSSGTRRGETETDRRIGFPAGTPAVFFHGEPNPLIVGPLSSSDKRIVTLTWNVTAPMVEILADSSAGGKLCTGGSSGVWRTDPLERSTIFYLQDASRGDARAPGQTLARLEVGVTAPPPATFTAVPNPAHVSDGTGKAVVTLHWAAPGATLVEVRVNSHDGPLLTVGGECETLVTGQWVTDGMVFFLQDVSRGDAPARWNTIGQLAVTVVDPVYAELLRCEAAESNDDVPDDSGLDGLTRVAVTFSPQVIRVGEPYRVCIPDFAGQLIDVGYELAAEQDPAPVIGVVKRWCELDPQGEATMLVPVDQPAGIVRITKVRSQTNNSRWHRAEGEIQVAGTNKQGVDA
jgi:hypothetical protein